MSGVITANIDYNLTKFMITFFSSFKFDSTSPTLAPGIHLTVVDNVVSFTFLRIEQPITSVFFLGGCVIEWGELVGNVKG